MKQILLSLFLVAVLYPGFSQNAPSMKERKHTTKSAQFRKQTESELTQKLVQKTYLFEHGAIAIKNNAQADSMLVKVHDQKSESWEPYMKEVPFYEGQSALIDELEQWYFENNSYRPEVKYKTGYDDRDRLVRVETHLRQDKGWMPFFATEYAYDDLDEEVFYGHYFYNEQAGEWEMVFGFRAQDEHNANGAIVLRTWEYYMGGAWLPEYKEEFVLNEQDVIIEIIESFYDEYFDEWEYEYRLTMELCENGMWEQGYGYMWDWWEEEWLPESKFIDIEWHDFSRMQFLQIAVMVNPDVWDDDDDWKNYDDIEWVLFMRQTHEYNDHGLMTLMLYEFWLNDDWKEEWYPFMKSEMHYDHLLNIVFESFSLFDGLDWMVLFGYEFEMDYNTDGSVKAFVFNEIGMDWDDWDEWKYELIPVIQYVYYYGDDTTDIPLVKLPVAADLKVYPNPASSHIHVELPEGNEYVEVAIFGVDGRQVAAYSLSGFSASQPVHIDVSGLKNGLYFVRVQGSAAQLATRFLKH